MARCSADVMSAQPNSGMLVLTRMTRELRGGDVVHYPRWTVVQRCDPPQNTRVEVERTATVRQVQSPKAEMLKKGADQCVWLDVFGSELPRVGVEMTWDSEPVAVSEMMSRQCPALDLQCVTYCGEDDIPPIPNYDAE
jgi:hypothetical protein